MVFRFQIICQFNVNCQCKLMDNNIFSIVILLFNSIQFNSILLSIPGNLFCLHAYIKYIGTYKIQVTQIHTEMQRINNNILIDIYVESA